MHEIDKTDGQPGQPKKANKNAFVAAYALYKSLPIGLRRIVTAGGFGFGVLVAVAVLHPNLQRWVFLVGATLNLLIALMVAIQAYIYVGQWDIMDKSLKRTDDVIEQMKQQVEAMQGQLTAIKEQNAVIEKSIETAELNSIYANRAYVTASHGIYRGSAGVAMHLRIENSGNTPANDVRVAYNYELRNSPPHKHTEGEPVVYDGGFTKQDRIGVIPPNGSHLIPTPQGNSQTNREYQRWKFGTDRFYCWGTIIYEDIFNKTRRTNFCFSIWGQAS